jgi:hypothetical protein
MKLRSVVGSAAGNHEARSDSLSSVWSRGLCVAAVAIASVWVAEVAWAGYVQGPTVAVSGPSPFESCTADADLGGVINLHSEVEPWIAIDPLDPRHLVAAWQQDRRVAGSARGHVLGVSFDAGATWESVVVPGLTRCSGGTYDYTTDPWLSFGADGTLFHIALVWNDPPDNLHSIVASRSTDGGLTWNEPVVLDEGLWPDDWRDKESITADPEDRNLVYATWSVIGNTDWTEGHAMFTRSTDGGLSWETPRMVFDPGPGLSMMGSQVFVAPNGDLVLLSVENAHLASRRLAVFRSTDKGVTWSSVSYGPSLGGPITFPPDVISAVRGMLIWADYAMDPKSGALYAVWQDDSFGPRQLARIAFAMSTDGGASWSTKIEIAQTPPASNPLLAQSHTPSVEVAANGTIGVTYYDYRYDVPFEPPAWTDYWFVRCEPRSRDCSDPTSWTGERRLTPDSFDLLEAARADVGGSALMLGDYMGLVRDGNDFLALFIQSFAGDPGSVYFTRLALEPDCSDGEDNDGDGLVDYPADPGCIAPYATPEDPQCDNGIDDDHNGLVDSDDPKCTPHWPYWEVAPACGLGAELALLVPLMRLVASRRRRISPERHRSA